MGHVRTSTEAGAVAKARNALIVMAALDVAGYALMTWVIRRLTNDPRSTPEMLDAAREIQRLVVVFAVGYGVLAYGLHRVSTVAWGLACLWSGYTVVSVVREMLQERVMSVIALSVALWVLGRLIDGDVVRACTRIGRPKPEPEPVEEEWRPPMVTPFPMAQPVVDTPAPPAPVPAPVVAAAAPPVAAPFDYFG